MRSHSLWRRLGILGLALAVQPAHALDPFFLTIDVNNDGLDLYQQGYSSINDAVGGLDANRVAGYSGTEAVTADLYLRGLEAELKYQSGSGDLFFVVPDPEQPDNPDVHLIFQSFSPRNPNDSVEAQRRDTLEQLKDYLREDRGALKLLLARLARFSPFDALAGNPDSLFSRRMRGDFDHGFTNKVSQIWGCGTSAFNFNNDAPIQVAAVGGVSDIFADAQARAAALQAQNEIGVGLLATSTTAKVAASNSQPGGSVATLALTVPFSYTVKLDSDPRKKVRFDLPLTYIDTEGAITYSVGAGLAYTHPLMDEWSLTPALGVGATGSEDLGAAGGVSAFSLTSAYTWRLDSFALSMGNSVGQYESLGLKLGDVEAEADISNTVFTNGFLLTGPNALLAKNLVIEYSLVDTRITGDEVYSDGYDEIGIALGHINTEMGVIDSYTKVGLSYLVADGASGDISSVRLNLTARF
jgi:hypothetical protein